MTLPQNQSELMFLERHQNNSNAIDSFIHDTHNNCRGLFLLRVFYLYSHWNWCAPHNSALGRVNLYFKLYFLVSEGVSFEGVHLYECIN